MSQVALYARVSTADPGGRWWAVGQRDLRRSRNRIHAPPRPHPIARIMAIIGCTSLARISNICRPRPVDRRRDSRMGDPEGDRREEQLKQRYRVAAPPASFGILGTRDRKRHWSYPRMSDAANKAFTINPSPPDPPMPAFSSSRNGTTRSAYANHSTKKAGARKPFHHGHTHLRYRTERKAHPAIACSLPTTRRSKSERNSRAVVDNSPKSRAAQPSGMGGRPRMGRARRSERFATAAA